MSELDSFFENPPEADAARDWLLLQQEAASHIQRAWRNYMCRSVFHFLVAAVKKAEGVPPHALLAQLSPAESELLRDPTINTCVRFRFEGTTFPPRVFYKIFQSGAQSVYLSGGVLADNNTQHQVLNQLGAQEYARQTAEKNNDDFLEQADCLDLRDYVRFQNQQDNKPIHKGGRGNLWRECFYDPSTVLTKGHSGQLVFEYSPPPRATFNGAVTLAKARAAQFTREHRPPPSGRATASAVFRAKQMHRLYLDSQNKGHEWSGASRQFSHQMAELLTISGNCDDSSSLPVLYGTTADWGPDDLAAFESPTASKVPESSGGWGPSGYPPPHYDEDLSLDVDALPEGEAEKLFEWAENLEFESYLAQWNQTATGISSGAAAVRDLGSGSGGRDLVFGSRAESAQTTAQARD
eukprot:GCRY01002635.1.p1 GENE.GCRY01002635.1~~GCRY01002635.1.p1  ORF type:complete len:409 (-),score=80.97 GCRY01002635.1:174-1400(-)